MTDTPDTEVTDYVPVVREYHSNTGTLRDWFLGGTRRRNNTRATSLCRHYHQDKSEAAGCAQRQTDKRNGGTGS